MAKAKTGNQRLAFDYLLERFRSQDTFSRQDFYAAVPDWSPKSQSTYWSKQIKHFLEEVSRDQFRVTEAFRPYANWSSFRKHVATQVRRTYSDYTALIYDNVIIYDFLMPLSNEGHLRTSLDALFYKDMVLERLRTTPREEIAKYFPIEPMESNEAYLNRICTWAAKHFGGYSISHVSGRFRAGSLATMAEVAEFQKYGGRYLIDETTAIVRFIFPCGEPRRRRTPISGAELGGEDHEGSADEPEEAARIRWFFRVLFVQCILQVVNGEDEIWMVESGMRTRLYRWCVEEV